MDELNDYIGDGVHVSFDRYHIWLMTNDPKNKVALEPAVLKAFFRYVEKVENYKKSITG